MGLPSGRTTTLLGRDVRLRYAGVKADLESFDPDETGMEALVAPYPAGSDASLPNVVDVDPHRLTVLFDGLADEGVVVDAADGAEPTATGWVAVGQRFDPANP